MSPIVTRKIPAGTSCLYRRAPAHIQQRARRLCFRLQTVWTHLLRAGQQSQWTIQIAQTVAGRARQRFAESQLRPMVGKHFQSVPWLRAQPRTKAFDDAPAFFARKTAIG